MNRKAFYHLLKRYLDDDCTEEEKQLVEQWYELLGDDEDREPTLPAAEIKETIQKLWPQIKDKAMAAGVPAPVLHRRGRLVRLRPRRAAVAVIITGIVIGAWWLFSRESDYQRFKRGAAQAGNMHTLKNGQAHNDTVYLNDNSMIVLEPNATLYYPDSFTSTKREVYLDGNAFFKVSKNPKRPFYVYSRNIVTQVLGTSFFVKTNTVRESVEVSVCTGKVAVYEYGQETANQLPNEESNGVILKPNQKVIYSRGDHHFRTTLVEVPVPVLPDNQADNRNTGLNFVFEETPVSKVLACLEQAYHIEMVLENETLANCLFSGDIKGQDLYDQLEILCQSVQATYEIRGTRILIKGSGCE